LEENQCVSKLTMVAQYNDIKIEPEKTKSIAFYLSTQYQ
jgi:hypothetical protein